MNDPGHTFSLATEGISLAIGIGIAIAARYRLRGARHWPMTHGKMEFCEALNEEGTSWTVHAYYSYSVGGDYYAGEHRLRVRNERQADEIVSALKGQTITVRYSPSAPETSTLLPADQMSFLEGALQLR